MILAYNLINGKYNPALLEFQDSIDPDGQMV